ncbi:unnamed protein product [Toxocara canis]|uniref:Pecanex-like protein n=1 Tax=Toxocara canis TaxID=6265 RepID=A0A183U491_TOXCA|nr:unnamed protein product [Toxocara canis]
MHPHQLGVNVEVLFSQLILLGLTELTYHNLNSGQYARVVRDVLLMLHYRLEVYTACDGEWTLKAKGWLGCLGDFEDVVGDSVELSELSTVMALSSTVEHGSDENRLSIAFCNLQDMRMTIAEFSDTDHFSNLEVSARKFFFNFLNSPKNSLYKPSRS